MFANYIKLALRNIAKHRLYAFINVTGLAIGLAVFLLGMILAAYERDHDSMFSQRDHIYSVGSVFAEGADIGVLETDSTYSAVGPLLEIDIDELEAVARTIGREYLVTVGRTNDSYYHKITFADPELTEIFNFAYLYGDASALSDPRGVILSESTAKKYFARSDVVGQTLTLDHEHDFVIKAVIRDIPADSHFTSSLLSDSEPRMFAHLDTLAQISDFSFDEDWGNLSLGDLTYVLLKEGKSQQWLSDQVNAVFERHAPEGMMEFIPELRVRQLVEANTMIWDAIGIPAITTVQIMGLLVLIVACVNYTNLATAQSLGRAREVGLRKTFGAERKQLLTQFLLESITVVTLSMLLALACLELLIPAFNEWSNKSVELDYARILPYLLLTTVVVGIGAGSYPAYMITRTNPIDGLQNTMLRGNKGGLFRSSMIGLQFTISVFMLACVLVMYFQNKQVERSSEIFPKDNVLILERVGVDDIARRHDTLRSQLLTVPGVSSMTYTSQVPFDQSNSGLTVTRIKGDEAGEVNLNQIRVDDDFLETFNIPLLAGRALTQQVAGDVYKSGTQILNVMINELAASSLGLAAGQGALGESFFMSLSDEAREAGRTPVQFNVVGVLPDQNFLGLHNKIKPMVFLVETDWFRAAAVRVRGDNLVETVEAIERVWDETIPDYPIQQRFLDDVFNDIFVVFKTMNNVLAGFALVALSLALIGLFGLAAFMAEQRTREIGVRKVLGARIDQIVRLLVWQFSKPVLWSLLIAMPAAYFASGLYLDFFDERITALPEIIAFASGCGLLTAWLIVAVHAVRVASASPITSLRYE